MIEINDKDEFLEFLAENEKVVVDFAAPAWCAPCVKFAPIFRASEAHTDAKFVEVDVDKAEWAMTDYGVKGVPSVQLFVGGEFVRDIKARTALPLIEEVR